MKMSVVNASFLYYYAKGTICKRTARCKRTLHLELAVSVRSTVETTFRYHKPTTTCVGFIHIKCAIGPYNDFVDSLKT